MFSFVFILAIASTAVELMIAAKIPAWRIYAHKYKLINLGLSILLSYIIGILFGAAGLIAMTAAIVSTIMSIPGYKILYWMYDSPRAQARGGNQYMYYKNSYNIHKAKWTIVLNDFFKIVYKILRVITFPYWMARAILKKYQIVRTRFSKP